MSNKPNEPKSGDVGAGEKKARPPILARRVEVAEHQRNLWHATTDFGTALEDTLEPGFWSGVAAKFQPGDRIEVRSEDHAYFAEIYIVDAGRQWAAVRLLRAHKIDDRSEAPPKGLEIDWAGPLVRNRVIRTSDRAVLKDQLTSYAAALSWAREHTKSLAA